MPLWSRGSSLLESISVFPQTSVFPSATSCSFLNCLGRAELLLLSTFSLVTPPSSVNRIILSFRIQLQRYSFCFFFHSNHFHVPWYVFFLCIGHLKASCQFASNEFHQHLYTRQPVITPPPPSALWDTQKLFKLYPIPLIVCWKWLHIMICLNNAVMRLQRELWHSFY